MCYSVYLSTSSPENLSSHNTEMVKFEKLPEAHTGSIQKILNHPHKWYVGSKSGCSCTFRHLLSTELGFGVPVTWYPEDNDEIEATLNLYGVISTIVSSGHHVDCADIWEGADPGSIKTVRVSLHRVPAQCFRLFENHRFVITK